MSLFSPLKLILLTSNLLFSNRSDGKQIDQPGNRLPQQKKHTRSSSCDVKITRSNSSNSDIDSRLKKLKKSHSRTNSRDYEFLNNNQMNSANNQHVNIRYIVNHLKKPMSNLNSNFNLNNNFKDRRRHMRNYSYGQEFSFLPNNAIIRLDNDLANSFLLSTSGLNSRHHSRKNSFDPSHIVDINLLTKKLNNQIISSDMQLDEEEADATDDDQQQQKQQSSPNPTTTNSFITNPIVEEEGTLRHRRTNSKDLNNQTTSSDSSTSSDLIKIDNGDKPDEML